MMMKVNVGKTVRTGDHIACRGTLSDMSIGRQCNDLKVPHVNIEDFDLDRMRKRVPKASGE